MKPIRVLLNNIFLIINFDPGFKHAAVIKKAAKRDHQEHYLIF